MNIKMNREFLKDTIRLKMDFSLTDQARGVPAPPSEKPLSPGAVTIALPPIATLSCGKEMSMFTAIARRKSSRRFLSDPISREELSFLCWATQGLRDSSEGNRNVRTVPSAGSRHSFETYLGILNVTDLEPGLYRYLPFSHSLVREFASPAAELGPRLTNAALGQSFVGNSAVVFIWTTVPYRMEWRYGLAAHRVIPMDVGHVCQNLYLACEGIGAGTCAVAAYDQEKMDELVRADGQDEFTIYLAPIGKVKPANE